MYGLSSSAFIDDRELNGVRISPDERLFREGKESHSLLPTYGWEVGEELAERNPRGEVIDEGVNGNAGANEHRLSTHDLGVGVVNF